MLNQGLMGYALPSFPDIPRSVIVFGKDPELSMEQRALKLIEKYVYCENGSCLFEVNVSSACKYALIHRAQELADENHSFSDQDLYALFDGMLMELLRVLTDSHIRFMQTDDYKELFKHNVV